MSSTDEVKVVFLEELGDDIVAKGKGDAARTLVPPNHFLFRVTPQQVTQQPLFRHIGGARNGGNLIEVLQVGRQATVHAQNLLVDPGSDGKAVEQIGKGSPQLNVVPALALVVKAVDAINGGTLVVATQQKEVLRVLNLVRKQQANRLQALLSTVNVVAKEEVVGTRRESSVFEQPKQVVVLPVNVTANLDRCLELQQNRLFQNNLSGTKAKASHLRLGKLHLLTWSRSSYCE
mmetsp:Transcript_15428/g.48182  ORF Transcript_15428/g.48182 Transcript_15428/m.48182 type:complete len:233 (+) Transcript_15428:607-1305(+)